VINDRYKKKNEVEEINEEAAAELNASAKKSEK
jgi:hypothetical protein